MLLIDSGAGEGLDAATQTPVAATVDAATQAIACLHTYHCTTYDGALLTNGTLLTMAHYYYLLWQSLLWLS